MLPSPIRIWLTDMPEEHYLQLKKMYQRVGYTDTWEQFIMEIYQEDQQDFPFTSPPQP